MADRLDPNRFAGSYEEPHLRAHVEEDELELDLLRTKSERAKRALDEADTRFRVIEQQYKEYKHIRDDAAAYAAEVQRKHEAQVAVVSLRKAYFHPIRKLAAETLERIFVFTIGDLSDVGRQTTPEDISTRQLQPFRLAAVCRCWRQAISKAAGPWRTYELLTKPTKPTMPNIPTGRYDRYGRLYPYVRIAGAAAALHPVFVCLAVVDFCLVAVVDAMAPLMRCTTRASSAPSSFTMFFLA